MVRSTCIDQLVAYSKLTLFRLSLLRFPDGGINTLRKPWLLRNTDPLASLQSPPASGNLLKTEYTVPPLLTAVADGFSGLGGFHETSSHA